MVSLSANPAPRAGRSSSVAVARPGATAPMVPAPKPAPLRLVVDRAARPAGLAPQAVAPPARATQARALADWVWSGLGIGAASASAGFAAYMLAFSSGTVTPSGNFNLFVHYDRRPRPAAARTETAEAAVAPDAGAVEPKPTATETAEADAIDFTPTGTIAAPSRNSQGDSTSGQSGRGGYSPNSSPLPNFTLRNVFDGKALVESRSSLSVVKPGSMLDGAGQVLSIERRGGSWVVLTDRGLIAGQRR